MPQFVVDGTFPAVVEYHKGRSPAQFIPLKNKEEKEMMKNEVRVCEHCGVIIGDGEWHTVDGYGRITCEECSQDMFY